jgi:hypothetical protein
VNAKAIGIAAGKQAATGSGANRLGDMEVAKYSALRGKAIEVRSDETSRAKDADICVTLIVSEDDDDVGERGAARSQCWSQARAGEQAREKLKTDEAMSGTLHADMGWSFALGNFHHRGNTQRFSILEQVVLCLRNQIPTPRLHLLENHFRPTVTFQQTTPAIVEFRAAW